ncbi:MAG: nucleotide exchange factor GrpE [Spirochaetes bacterium]|nr:nucleotide exchange factor GrpE [Spirochaetota bacterium]
MHKKEKETEKTIPEDRLEGTMDLNVSEQNTENVQEHEHSEKTKHDKKESKAHAAAELKEIEFKAELEKREKEIAEIKDLMIRRQADFENFKKRMLKNAEQDKKLSIKDIAVDIIEINDNLLRASDAAETIKEGVSIEEAHKLYVEGVRMISRSIETMLEKYGIEEIESENVAFDPNIHEAIEITTADEVNDDTVTHVYQKGFKFEEFVIRCAKVRVTKPAAAGTANAVNESSENSAE